MREIKFRAWDKVLGEMFYSSELCNGDIMVLHLDGRIEISDDDTYKPDDFILMQYTGLKDKNGREIYELDKVKVEGYWPDYVIRFHRGSFYVCHMSASDPEGVYWYTLGDFSENCIKVIGSIHDNPELIESEDE